MKDSASLAETALVERLDQVHSDFPERDVFVSIGSVRLYQLRRRQEPDLPALGVHRTRTIKPLDRGVVRGRKGLGLAVRCLVEAVGFEPLHTPPRVGVEVTLLVGEHLGEHSIDQPKRLAHAHVGPAGLDYPREAREDGHPGTDRRLGEVHRRNGAVLKLAKFGRKLVT